MNSHPEDSAPKGPLTPPSPQMGEGRARGPAAGGPQPRVIASTGARSRKAVLTVLALVLAAVAGSLWLGLNQLPARHEGQSPSGTEPQVTPSVVARPSPDARRTEVPSPGMVDLSSLRGEGLTVAEFAALIEKAAAQPVKCDVLKTPLGALRFSAYDGAAQVPVRDALGMLRYAGLAAEQSQKDAPINVNPIRSKERMLELLSAGVDPDGPDWGALRPWRGFKVSSALKLEALVSLAQAAPENGAISALEWAMPGAQHLVRVADDGRVTQQYSRAPSQEELQDAEKLLVKLACFPGAEANPATRAAAIAGLGAILRLDSHAQLQANSPLVRALGVLLKDPDAEVSRAASLAAGNSAAVAVLALLVEHLVAQRLGPDQAADLVALRQAEWLGRGLDRQMLGAADWERRRALSQTVSSWLTTTTDADAIFSAAWLRALEAFCPGPARPDERAKAVEQRLWQSGIPQAQLVVLSVDRTGKRLAAPDLPAGLQLAVAAGPLWPRSRFPLEQAAAWLGASDIRFVQAALWRLSRVEQRGPGKALAGDANAALINTLMAFAANNPSPILRRLAVEALYRERQQKNAAGTWEKFHLSWDTRPALRSFSDDKDGAVQTAAAGAVGRLADSTELSGIAQPGLRDRAPEAVARLLEALGDRLIKSTGQTPELTQAIAAVCDLCLDFGNDAVEQQAGWLRMNDPEMPLEAKVRLLSSFKTAQARLGCIRALGLSGARTDWTAKLVLHLLADNSPDVRAALFRFRLPASVNPKEDGAELWLAGLRDTDSQVRLAALKALGQATQQTQNVLQCISELAADDPAAEVRNRAAALLRSVQNGPAQAPPRK